jgi:glycosyltransferase involved in cell wall biosynthesis
MIIERVQKITVFLSYLGGGGADQMMANMANGFSQKGYQTDLVLGKAFGPHLWKVSSKVNCVDLNCEHTLPLVFALARYLKQVQPDALISTLHYANEAAILAKKISRVNTRVFLREANTPTAEARFQREQFKRRITPLLIRYLYPWADGIIGVSQGVSDDIAEIIGLPYEKIHTIYNPAITPQLFERAKESVDHPWLAAGEPPVILGVGKLQRQKDFSTLIHAFAKVKENRPARLIILGWGPERSDLESLVRELELEEYVSFPDYVKNPYAYMARAAVFVLSSLWEGLPNVLIEALAVGVPVVSTNCRSGPEEILDRGKYGLLTPIQDSQALASAILRTLSEPKKPVSSSWLEQFTLETAQKHYLHVLGID